MRQHTTVSAITQFDQVQQFLDFVLHNIWAQSKITGIDSDILDHTEIRVECVSLGYNASPCTNVATVVTNIFAEHFKNTVARR